MAFYDTTWYTNFGNGTSTGYYAVTVRPQNTAVAAGVIRRQFTAPAVGSERVFVCIVAGTTANTTDATWTVTRGAKTTDGTATWQECTGASAVNGDLTNTPTWTQAKAIGSPTLGAIIQRNNGASYWICSTSGVMGGTEPAWPNNTAGTTQADSGATWTCLGVVGNFTGGQAPHARLVNACASTWMAAGNTIYIADNHAESQTTAITITPQGSATTVGRILCHDHSGSYPPTSLMTGATVTTTAAASITLAGATVGYYVYGVAFQAGSGASGAAGIVLGTNVGGIYLENCSLQVLSTGVSTISLGSSTAGVTWLILNNTPLKFGAVGSSINLVAGNATWMNTAPALVTGSSVPTNLFNLNQNSTLSNLVVEAVDLGAIPGVLTYSQPLSGSFLFKDCKLNASATFGTPMSAGVGPQIVRCDSGATAYKSARYAYEGTETTETSITRVGGAVDPTTQAQSRKIVTTANVQWLRPFKAEPFAIWNSTTGSNVTVTVYGTINAGSVPNNDDIWMEVEYLGSSATPLGTIVTTTKSSVLASNAAVASDGSTWNGGGSGGGWSPFKLTTTLSSPQPGLAGYLQARVRAAKVSTTYYIDPKIELT